MLSTAIILNGPPHSGKDTLAKIIADTEGYQLMEFKDALFRETAKYFGVDYWAFRDRHNNREMKELVWHELQLDFPFYSQPIYISTREALIFVSEFVIKKAHNIEFFGDAAVEHCTDIMTGSGLQNFVFSDGGFPDETRPMVKAFDEVFIFHLHRDGCSFDGDSRDYVHGFPNTYPLYLAEGKPEIAVMAIMATVHTTPRGKKAA